MLPTNAGLTRRFAPGQPRTRRETSQLSSADRHDSRTLLTEAAQNAHFSSLLAAVVNGASSSR